MIGPQEQTRLAELHGYRVLDTPPHRMLDELVSTVSRIFDVPIVLVCLVDLDRQWFLARHGLDVQETSRAVSFCDHVVCGRQAIRVEDARLDARFAHNPLVTAGLQINAYAGAPLITPDGHILGTLCLVDNQRTRRFSDSEMDLLGVLATSVMAHVETHRAHHLVVDAEARAEASHKARARFVSQLTHDLRGPMAAIRGYSELIEESIETATLEEITSDICTIKQANAELEHRLNALVTEVDHDSSLDG